MNSPLVLGVNIIACDGRPARREEALPASPGAGGAVSAGGERRLVLLEQAERRAATAGGTSPGILCGGEEWDWRFRFGKKGISVASPASLSRMRRAGCAAAAGRRERASSAAAGRHPVSEAAGQPVSECGYCSTFSLLLLLPHPSSATAATTTSPATTTDQSPP